MGGGYFIDDGATATLTNELIFGNDCGSDGGSGIYVDSLDATGTTGSIVSIRNSTIADNNCTTRDGGNGVYVEGAGSTVTIVDTIFWGNQDDFFAVAGGVIQANYTLSQEPIEGSGNIQVAPGFAQSKIGDYRLKSTSGRWVPSPNGWVKDSEHSSAIDRGSPDSSFAGELSPNGGRVNLGAYGNTAQASLSK